MNKIIIKQNFTLTLSFSLLFVFMFSIFVLPNTSFGQVPKDPGGTIPKDPSSSSSSSTGMIKDPLGKNGSVDVGTFFKNVVQSALKIGIPFIALAIIYCGFLYVTALGKPEAITHAHRALLYTLIGAAVLLGAWAISELIVTTVGNLA